MPAEIGRLLLQLPTGFEDRAGRIGRLVGEALAQRDDLPAGRIEQLQVGPVRVDVRDSDRAVAQQIADSIHAAVKTANPV
jgi:hypothetical protein